MSGGLDFPIRGVVGVLGGDERTIAQAVEALERPGSARPDAVEVRADLFEDPRRAVELLGELPRNLPAVFTVRLPGHGGKFQGMESDRLALYREALRRGAALVDAEWESEAARELRRAGAPLVVSHHNFGRMPGPAELERLTREMTALDPLAIKLVPSAEAQSDSVRMLEWTAARGTNDPARIGFAMGELGLASRVLSIGWGAPYTYASLGNSVAPGQASVADMKGLYRAGRLTRRTRVLGVIGNPIAHSLSPHMHNPALEARGIDAVYLPLRLAMFSELAPIIDPLGIDGLSVTIPFKEDVFRSADVPDERSKSSGASNTLVFRRERIGRRTAHAFNTDFDGVLGPLRRRSMELHGLSAAILGNGGAARAAARALLGAGAAITLYFRNPDRGVPVARELGVPGAMLGDLAAGRHGLILNATPLGLKPEDPSPVPEAVFTRDTWAFDMVYDPPETAFLEAARAAGAQTIPGREMLVSQGLVQFELFTGRSVSYEELEAGFLAGQAARKRTEY